VVGAGGLTKSFYLNGMARKVSSDGFQINRVARILDELFITKPVYRGEEKHCQVLPCTNDDGGGDSDITEEEIAAYR
jgi:hypothetical protein